MARVKFLNGADVFIASIPVLSFQVTQLAAGATTTVGSVKTGNNYAISLGIPRGDRGITGLTPALTIGNVVTGAVGSSVTVGLRGTTDNPIFDFTIPRGNTGLTPSFTIGNVTTVATGGSATAGLRGTTDNPILDLGLPRGATGATPTLTIGNVTTIAPGGSATAGLRGTAEAPILDLGLVKGTTGNTPSLTIGNVTTLTAGGSAAASLRGTVDNPILDFSIPRGNTGLTPAFTIGTVTTLNPGTSATATLGGTTDAPVLNLGIPRGTPGSGSGDVLAANNLSELANKDTALTNLGGTATGVALFKTASIAAARTTLQLGTAALVSTGTASGNVPVLDVTGKLAVGVIPDAALGAAKYQGTWNANTNVISPGGTAMPAASSTNKGWYYKVTTAGTTNIDGINDWGVGDWIISNGSTYDKVDNSEQITTVVEATAAEYRSATAGRVLAPDKVWVANQVVTLTQSDLNSGLNFNNFINGTYNLNSGLVSNIANPVGGMKPGQSGVITIVNETLSGFSLTFGDQWFSSNGALPTLPTAPPYVVRMYYTITSTSSVDFFFSMNVSRTYDIDATAYFAAMNVQPSNSRKILINDFIKGLKTDGIWVLLDNLWLLASHDEQSSLKNLVRPTKSLLKYGTPFFVVDKGWQQTATAGNASAYSLYTPDAYFGTGTKRSTINNGSFGVWQNTTFSETQSGNVCGELTNAFYDYINYNNSQFVFKIAGNQLSSSSGAIKGFKAVSNIATSIYIYSANSTAALTSPGQNYSNGTPSFSLLNAGNNGSYNGTNNRQAAGFTGAGLTDTQLVAFNNRLSTYLTAIGAN